MPNNYNPTCPITYTKENFKKPLDDYISRLYLREKGKWYLHLILSPMAVSRPIWFKAP